MASRRRCWRSPPWSSPATWSWTGSSTGPTAASEPSTPPPPPAWSRPPPRPPRAARRRWCRGPPSASTAAASWPPPPPRRSWAFHGPAADVEQPIRVYAGLRSAGSPDERAALAVRELERTGAFQREVLGVITTTGTGWVDPDAASSVEYLHAGDTALVGLQYSYLPSWISFLVDRDEAAETGTALYQHVHRRWSRLPATDRPRLLVFGESLGSFGAEAAFRGGDAAASLDKLVAGSDGALLTGPTASNHVWDQLTDDREPGSPVWRPVYDGGTRVQFANRPADLERPDQGWRPPRVLYVPHPSDPVGNATLEAFGGARSGPTGRRATTSLPGPAGTRSSPGSRRCST
jgi:Alpha/beta-hydrolase family